MSQPAAADPADPTSDLFRELVDNLPELAWTARPDGHIDFYNRRWYEYTGTTYEEMQGWGWEKVHNPAMLPLVVERWKHSLATGQPFEMEFTLRGADGVDRWFLTRVMPLRGFDGQITRWFGTNVQVDAQRRLLVALSEAESRLKEENELNASLLRLGDAFARELDDQKLLQLVTDEATRLTAAEFGAFFFNVEKAEGGSYMLYTLSGVPKSAFEKFPMPRATPLFGPTFRGEAPIRLDDVRKDPRFGKWGPLPDGHLPVVSYLAVPVIASDGAVLGGLFFGHGEAGRFTAQHERLVQGISSQASVALTNARLYRSLREEREKVKEAYEVAQTADRRKDEFLAMLGHELRNPLAPILTALHLIRLRGSDGVTREIDVIERQAQHLVRLVDDLLDVSRVARGKVTLARQSVEIADVIASAVETTSPLMENARQKLVTNVPRHGLVVDVDRVRMVQVISNLLTNAAKYTPPGGRIGITAKRVGAEVVVDVEDTGAGISAELLPDIFDLFVQAGQTLARSQGGLGLGLAIVKSLVATHDGTVTAKSDGLGKGSCFTLRLPAVDVHSEAPVERTSVVPTVRSRQERVLVVDDNPDAAEMLSAALEMLGYQTAIANDGAEALRVAAEFQPHTVLLDIGLPVMDGYEVADRLRKTFGNAITMFAVTGYGQDVDRQRSRDAGFNDHLTKPVDFEKLAKLLEEAAASATA